MRGCLFTLLLGAVAIALLVFVGLPQVAAGILTGAVTAAGLQADDTTVTVSSELNVLLVGIMLVGFITLAPQGIVGLVRKYRKKRA